MIYKYRYLVITLAFLTLLIVGSKLFGYVECKDGWKSSSIGLRGACSHHGGVTSNFYLIILAAGIISYALHSLIDSKYRVYNKIIVSAKLPRHPLEKEAATSIQFTRYPIPKNEAVSRKEFQCNLCKVKFNKGVKYKYFLAGNHRTKYCFSCAPKLKSVNNSIKSSEAEYNKARNAKLIEIHDYYKKNAKAVLN